MNKKVLIIGAVLVAAFFLFKDKIMNMINPGNLSAPANGTTPVSKSLYTQALEQTDFATGGNSQQAANLAANQYQKTPYSGEIISYLPKPGYQGPINGPFTWGGVGDPPDGVWVTIGNPVYK
jgi:hypothetical protein